MTGLSGVPSTFALLLHRSAVATMQFPALRYVSQAGGPMAPVLIRKWRDVMPAVSFFVMYGATEASARLAYLDRSELDARMGSIVRAVPTERPDWVSKVRGKGSIVRRCFVAKASSQKFIARNRAPRVQIEYDVELYGAEKKIQLPFVMGVLADLSGKPADPLPPVADRKFLEIDVDNFDSRMKAMKPRAAFQVPNTLTGEGNLSVELTFESMDDFTPAAVARKVDALGKLLDTRQQLANLITYMDGKSGAEELVSKLLNDPALLQTLASAKKPQDEPSS